MQFSTPIKIESSLNKIDYHSKVLLLGSCFSENIGNRFQYYKFQTEINPFGIVFNAVSLEKLIHRIVTKTYFTEKDIFFHNELWHSFEVHSELSHPNKEEFLLLLNKIIEFTNRHIDTVTHCLITLGTSWVYRHKKTNQIVANCHKVNQSEFEKILLTPEENLLSIKNSIERIQSINSKAKFIFTLSPVRHIKDGFFENNVSKGNLFSALYQLVCLSEIKSDYFPSYEIVMDELRDYRFFEKDMLHPNSLAIDYIWKCFSQVYFSEDTCNIINQVEKIQKGLLHRPINPESVNHQKFVSSLQEKINNFKNKLPHIQF